MMKIITMMMKIKRHSAIHGLFFKLYLLVKIRRKKTNKFQCFCCFIQFIRLFMFVSYEDERKQH